MTEQKELSFDEQYIATQLAKYSKKVYPEFAKGLNVKLLRPENMSKADLLTWFRYKTHFLQTEELHFEEVQLIYVWMGLKPMALIDVDYYPKDSKHEWMNEESTFIRHVSTHNMGIKTIMPDLADDTATLYYDKDNWINALLYTMFTRKLLPEEIQVQIEQCWLQFTSILLGYTSDSTLDYSAHVSIYDLAYDINSRYHEYVLSLIRKYNANPETSETPISETEPSLIIFSIDRISNFQEFRNFDFTMAEIKALYSEYYKKITKKRTRHIAASRLATQIINDLTYRINKNPIYKAIMTQDIPKLFSSVKKATTPHKVTVRVNQLSS